MAYTPPAHTPYTWHDLPATDTPLDAAHLEAAENDLVAYTQSAVTSYDSYAQATFAQAGSTGAQGLTPTAVKTANYTAVAADFVPCDTSGGGFTVTLPTAPADKTRVGVKIVKQASTPNALTIAAGGSDVFNVAAGSTTLTLQAKFQAVVLQYASGTGIWYAQSTDSPLGQAAGAASLDTGGHLTSAQVPASVLLHTAVTDLCRAPYSCTPATKLTVTLNGTTTATVTAGVAPASGAIIGPNIPQGTTFTASGSTLTLSNAATGSGSVSAWVGMDITTALQTYVNSVPGTGMSGKAYFSVPGTFLLNGPQQTGTALGYSYSGQILYPAINFLTSPNVAIDIDGLVPPTSGVPTTGQANGVVLLSSAASGYVFDIIPAVSQWGWQWTAIMPIYRNLILRLPSNPQCGGINNLNALRAKYERIQVDNLGGGWLTWSQLTGTLEAIVGPHSANNADVTFRDVSIRNHPIGIRVSEHYVFEGNTEIVACTTAFVGNGGGHRNYLGYVDVEECQYIFRADGSGASIFLIGFIDMETGTGFKPCLLVDDPYGSMINGSIDLTVGNNGGIGYVGGSGVDITNKAHGYSAGWASKHPIDDFTRIDALAGSAQGAPGLSWPTFHPWRVAAGGFNVSGNLLQGTTGFDKCLVPVKNASLNGVPRSVQTIFNLAASGYSVGQLIGRRYDTSQLISTQLKAGKLYLNVGALATGVGVESATIAAITGGATITLLTEVYYEAGSPKTVKVYLNGTLQLVYVLTSAQQTAIAASTTRPYLEDGVYFTDGDATSTVGSGTAGVAGFAVNDVSSPATSRTSPARLAQRIKALGFTDQVWDLWGSSSATGTSTPATTNMYGTLCGLTAGDQINNLWVALGAVGAGTTPTGIYLAVYSTAGVQLGVTANLAASAIWTTATQPVSAALVTPYIAPVDQAVYLCFLENGTWGTTQAKLINGYQSALVQGHTLSGGSPMCVLQSGQTVPPTPATFAQDTTNFWFGWS